jgi:hypothetical protein
MSITCIRLPNFDSTFTFISENDIALHWERVGNISSEKSAQPLDPVLERQALTYGKPTASLMSFFVFCKSPTQPWF